MTGGWPWRDGFLNSDIVNETSGRAAAWGMLLRVCLALVLAMTTWFSATAIIPELTSILSLNETQSAWLTNGVQIGFVTGALLSSAVNLPDIVRIDRLLGIAALLAAGANACLLVASTAELAFVARFATGVALAGVYPPAVKLVSTWFKTGRGLALGAVIGALCLGSAAPHLVRALTIGLDWRLVVSTASIATAIGALIFLFLVREGPHPFSRAVFSPRQIGEVVRNRALMLANLGYFGHMWELYAFWGWLLTYSMAALQAQGAEGASVTASLLTFAAVATGAVGCVGAGWLADRIGRTATCILMMAVSGSCALLIGFLFTGPFWAFALLVIIWGIFVIGDSAQFSAMATEVSDARFVGTALTFQMGIGFSISVISIWLTPHVAAWLGSWHWTFIILAPGPLIGIAAMWALRREAVASKIANGRM